MSSLLTRAARREDLPRLTEIYNHYVVHSPATFDLEPKTLDQHAEWFAGPGFTELAFGAPATRRRPSIVMCTRFPSHCSAKSPAARWTGGRRTA